MGKRRRSREIILKLLYQKELNEQNPEDMLEQFWHEREENEEVKIFVASIFCGVNESKDELDTWIMKYSKNWDLNRLSIIDKCILRLSVYELLHRKDIPPKVSINEAIDISKKYSNADAGKFINGILDKVSKECSK
ncbi:transcription antitermination factor NusB [PVC group bacterium]|nr:transcription antitermination factor NusB [PVC group bacterium]